jgi:hypothetical protein
MLAFAQLPPMVEINEQINRSAQGFRSAEHCAANRAIPNPIRQLTWNGGAVDRRGLGDPRSTHLADDPELSKKVY